MRPPDYTGRRRGANASRRASLVLVALLGAHCTRSVPRDARARRVPLGRGAVERPDAASAPPPLRLPLTVTATEMRSTERGAPHVLAVGRDGDVRLDGVSIGRMDGRGVSTTAGEPLVRVA